MDKLDRWTEDGRASVKTELAELDDAFKEAKKAVRLAPQARISSRFAPTNVQRCSARWWMQKCG